MKRVCVCVSDDDLLDVVAEEDKVDAAEAELGDDQKQVHRLSEGQRDTAEVRQGPGVSVCQETLRQQVQARSEQHC